MSASARSSACRMFLVSGTCERVLLEKKAGLIRGVTDLLVGVLNKNPAQTFVVSEEVDTDRWGIAGVSVTKHRNQEQDSVGHSGG